jgi:glucose-1-phosphate thymidylyltransferase
MKGVILAGGSGSRLHPLTKVTNKHLLPVGEKPMIFYAIEKLTKAGITDIMVITGTGHMGSIVQCLGSGKDFDCSFTYRVQDEHGGIAQALGLCRGHCYGERLCILLGDNIFQDDLKPYLDVYREQERGAMVLLKRVPDPQRYGVAIFDEFNNISRIEEKPKNPQSDHAVTGVYFYDQKVFNIIDELRPSARGELEISDVNNRYLEWGELRFEVLKGYWTDAGTLTSLQHANELVRG